MTGSSSGVVPEPSTWAMMNPWLCGAWVPRLQSNAEGEASKIMRERHPSSDYLFPADHGGLLSNRAPESLIHRQLNLPCSVHGFRSSLRDWLGQRDRHAARDVRGNFVAHRLRVEGACGRSSSTEKKRAALELWAAYLAKERFVVDLIGV